MITYVKHLQEALQRFSPDARLKYELEVQGPSPATECSVTIAGDDPISKRIEELENFQSDLEGQIADLTNQLAKATAKKP